MCIKMLLFNVSFCRNLRQNNAFLPFSYRFSTVSYSIISLLTFLEMGILCTHQQYGQAVRHRKTYLPQFKKELRHFFIRQNPQHIQKKKQKVR